MQKPEAARHVPECTGTDHVTGAAGTIALTESVEQTALTVAECKTRLLAQLSPGFTDIVGNEPLEGAYIDYRAATFDEQHGDNPNYCRFDQLSEREIAQAKAMIDQLVHDGIAPRSILEKRLFSSRILIVDSHTSFGKSVGGQYIDGLTVVAREVNGMLRPTEEQNHAKLHEMAHGLEAPNALVVIGNDVMVMGRGLVNQRRVRTEAMLTLNNAKEAVVDTLTTSVSDLDTAAYLGGDMPDVGYWEFNNGLRRFTMQNPAVSRALWEGTFYRGAQDRSKAMHIAAAYEPYLPLEASQ